MKADIGIIGAMDVEVRELSAALENRCDERVGGLVFHTGTMFGKNIVLVKCGIGKVFAAIAAEAMILRYSPSLIVNTGVGGALAKDLSCADVVVASSLIQHDMDTSAIGDPVGLVSGINKIFFESDERASSLLLDAAREMGIKARLGVVASGDKFIADKCDKERIVKSFSADACEMEGAAIAQTAFVNSVPFAVVRAISDSADEGASMDYPSFLAIAADNSKRMTLSLIKKY